MRCKWCKKTISLHPDTEEWIDEDHWYSCIGNIAGNDHEPTQEIPVKRNGRILLSGTWTEKECAKTAVKENVRKLFSSMLVQPIRKDYKNQILNIITKQSDMPHHEAEAWFNAVCRIHNQDAGKIAEAVAEL